MDKNNFVTTKKAADILGVSTSTIYRMVEQKLLKPTKTPGGQRRFSLDDLDAYKESSKSLEAPQNPSKSKIDESTPIRKEADPRNTLNDLNGTEWLPETKSFFFQKGLGAKHPHAQIERLHPAPYSFQDVEHLIAFFTKSEQRVLDPFGGIGSTA
ncbi:MAG: modification methylase, partial [Firmicutes bacterium]|nr:modification methylase [Bacillota bacterium]